MSDLHERGPAAEKVFHISDIQSHLPRQTPSSLNGAAREGEPEEGLRKGVAIASRSGTNEYRGGRRELSSAFLPLPSFLRNNRYPGKRLVAS